MRQSSFLIATAYTLAHADGNLGYNSSTITDIPASLTYFLPAQNFSSVLDSSFENGTSTSNATINALLRQASQSTFVSYSPEFRSILGSNPTVQSIACPSNVPACAFEAGVWLPQNNSVWFSQSAYGYPQPSNAITSFDLGKQTATVLNTSMPLSGPNGAYLFDGKVWFGTFGIPPSPARIVSVDPITLEVKPLLNSYFGLPLQGADDIVWVTRGSNRYMYFTALDFALFLPGFPPNPLPNAVYRFDPQNQTLAAVIDRTDIGAPNGIRISPDQQTLYVTQTVLLTPTGGGIGNFTDYGTANFGTTIPAIYKYTLDADGFPVNKRLFSLTRTGVPDGIHVDDQGRVWTAEYDGIVVRSPTGKILGKINEQALVGPDPGPAGHVANFALAGNKIVAGAQNNAIVITLNQTLVSSTSIVVN